MPELVEAECARQLCLKLVGKKISECWIEDRDFKIFSFPCPELCSDHAGLASLVTGSTVTDASRKGKQLVLHLDVPGRDGTSYLFLNLGMSGAVCVQGEPYPRHRVFDVSNPNGEWPPLYPKLRIDTEDVKWVFCDVRRFGKVYVTNTVEDLNRLAPDALTDLPAEEEFLRVLADQDRAIKTVLLDQHLLLSGLGNWTADEILYQAAIHPESRASLLQAEHVQKLHFRTKQILETAVGLKGSEELPNNWLCNFYGVAGKAPAAKGSGGRQLDFMGREIVQIKSGGRSSMTVPAVQQKLEGSSKRTGMSNLVTYRKRLREEKEAAERTTGSASNGTAPPAAATAAAAANPHLAAATAADPPRGAAHGTRGVRKPAAAANGTATQPSEDPAPTRRSSRRKA